MSHPRDKLKLKGWNLGRVFDSRCGRASECHDAITLIIKQPDLKLKTWSKQLLGSLPLAFALPYINWMLSLSMDNFDKSLF
jgi:hypothetical protein